MDNIFFKVEKLTVGYDGRPLVKDIDISIERGKILTLIGPNGSGKSTILKSIARQLKKISGCVYVGKAAEWSAVGGGQSAQDGKWSAAEGKKSVVDGKWLVADGEKSAMNGKWSVVDGEKSAADGKKSAVGGLINLDSLADKEFARTVSVMLTEKVHTELLTCGDVAAMGRYPYTGRLGILSEEDRMKAFEALRIVGLEELIDMDFMRISDGQRQRVLLARAICQEPEIMVLDEPTSFLDIKHKLMLLEILRKLAAVRGVTVIMSLHELELAQKVSDYVMCVKGELVERQGTPEEIFTSEVIGDLYDLDNGRYSEIFGSVELKSPEREPEVFVIAGGGTGAAVFRRLQRQGICFSAGVLHENDVDYELARTMAVRVISERPFCHISDGAYEAALEEMRKCRKVICCLDEFGEMNEKNRMLAEEAERMGVWKNCSRNNLDIHIQRDLT